ncbi:MAG: four helix bundle protein [Bacteroidales bacterium]|nr:four helix bundle protein [Bacteroidales bacterium]MDD3666245.1 four helix bundle protein [Bacteroidales bacterium]
MTITRFEDLEIWQLSRELNRIVKGYTHREAFSRDFRFIDQITSSCGSVMDCIAEGFERDGTKEFIQFLSIAKGSCGEARSQCYRAFDFSYISSEELNDILLRTDVLRSKISNFISYLKSCDLKGKKYK